MAPDDKTDSRAALPRWLCIIAALVRLVYPLAVLGAAVFLFWHFGWCGWLWLVLLLVLAFCVFRPSADGLG